ncbi:hypothetical protein BT63DRAFT_449353 [Microthyrium microscopicum]|uniref:Apple domain-containing protein n=1 Tax=Microthyrium microscopicum TaxID=703497 RepID=A0A6A6URH6_9PEZI|nr:hypothetical protein BT63DRAFT_449353 [Microthyrium microscopicum]
MRSLMALRALLALSTLSSVFAVPIISQNSNEYGNLLSVENEASGSDLEGGEHHGSLLDRDFVPPLSHDHDFTGALIDESDHEVDAESQWINYAARDTMDADYYDHDDQFDYDDAGVDAEEYDATIVDGYIIPEDMDFEYTNDLPDEIDLDRNQPMLLCEGDDCGNEEEEDYIETEGGPEEGKGKHPREPWVPAPLQAPYPVPCKGNCPLKHNLLPKYEPDDGGKLKCPEHNGRIFESKQGARFEIACYADFGGRDMKMETETSLDACINTCTSVRQCKAIVFVPNELDGSCYLKFNEGKSHVNPFVMSARVVGSNCAAGVSCDRHNKVWEMEQEEARRDRHLAHIEETRERIETLRKERTELEKSRQEARRQRIREQLMRQSQEAADNQDRARLEEFQRAEEDYRRKKDHENLEHERDRVREQRRLQWKLAVEERERERLRHQVEAEREALNREKDKSRQQQWSDDESWWDDERQKTHPVVEIDNSLLGKQYYNTDAVQDANINAQNPEFENVGPNGYPTDDEWHWYPDPSWRGYWDVEKNEREHYAGYVTEDGHERTRYEVKDEWQPYQAENNYQPDDRNEYIVPYVQNPEEPCCFDTSRYAYNERPRPGCEQPCQYPEVETTFRYSKRDLPTSQKPENSDSNPVPAPTTGNLTETPLIANDTVVPPKALPKFPWGKVTEVYPLANGTKLPPPGTQAAWLIITLDGRPIAKVPIDAWGKPLVPSKTTPSVNTTEASPMTRPSSIVTTPGVNTTDASPITRPSTTVTTTGALQMSRPTSIVESQPVDAATSATTSPRPSHVEAPPGSPTTATIPNPSSLAGTTPDIAWTQPVKVYSTKLGAFIPQEAGIPEKVNVPIPIATIQAQPDPPKSSAENPLIIRQTPPPKPIAALPEQPIPPKPPTGNADTPPKIRQTPLPKKMQHPYDWPQDVKQKVMQQHPDYPKCNWDNSMCGLYSPENFAHVKESNREHPPKASKEPVGGHLLDRVKT